MKILKIVLITLLALVIVYLVVSLFMPKQIKVERTVIINAPAKAIYQEVTDFRTWGDWSPWNQMDPNIQNEYSDKMGGKGAWTRWKSEEVGDGRQEIVETTKPTYAKYEMTFGESTDKNYAIFNLEEQEEGVTQVTWSMEGAESALYMRPMNAIFEPMIADNYELGLKNLKAKVEDNYSKQKELKHPSAAHMMNVEPIKILSIKDSTNAEGISNKLREIYTEIMVYISSTEGLEEEGMPLAIYHIYSKDKVILEGAIPYAGEAKESGRIKVKETPAGKTVMKVHYGSYASSEQAHMEIDGYIQENELEMTGSPWEIYANDPSTVQSEDEIETHIYYPVR